MIARIWRGATKTSEAGSYIDYLLRTGIDGHLRTPGDNGAWILCGNMWAAGGS